MILADLSRSELERRLAGPGLRLRAGPVVTQVQSPLGAVADGVALHYAAHPIEDNDGFADFFVRVDRPRNLRRWLHPQAVFYIDGEAPFTPLPLDQAFPLLEWGLNWCISAHCHQYLIFHAAVVERSGRALILPAPPGSGKSTLCAGLIHRGWRRLLHFNLTSHPTATWTLQQLREVIGFEATYRFLLHDRQSIFACSLDESIGHRGLAILK